MIVFCITCKNRTQHLEQTLPENIWDNRNFRDCKFVLLDYNSPDHMVDFLRGFEWQALIASGRLVVYRYTTSGPFRMAHAKNMAHRLGILEGGDILVNLDADNFTGPDFAAYVAEKFDLARQNGAEPLLWARWNQPGMEPGTRIPKGCCGRIAVSAQGFLKVGGYDEVKFDTWGPDDKDFHFRLRRLGYVPQTIDPRYLLAVLHTDRMRFKEYPEAREKATDYSPEWFNDCDNAISNFGKFGMGTVFRNRDPWPIELIAMPTRIFGIGMHKTATTSLHTAFRVLGFDSGHWKSVRWAKQIWMEMTETGKSRTLEKRYALSDLPFTLLYRELDIAYPGSKFILTTRDEESWVESVRRHFSDANNFRDTWLKEESFGEKIHKELYGITEFDAGIFLERFRRHNAEVKEYFKNRPGDLLIMDMSAGTKTGWLELCGFLKQPLPDVPYPKQLVTPNT